MEDDEDENNEKDFRRSKRRNERRELLTTTLQQRRTNDEKYATKGVKVESDAENAETNGGSAAAAAAKEKMFQILRDSASWDPDVEKLLEGIDASDPDAIEQAIRKRFDEKKSGVYKPLNEDGVGDEGSNDDNKNGSPTPTLVFFRQVETQNLWVWMEARNTIEDKRLLPQGEAQSPGRVSETRRREAKQLEDDAYLRETWSTPLLRRGITSAE